ncbi:TPA: N-acetyltransferase [Candidatus Delongbacteria bacterium]|nr:N-acetyltransferase [Candidatus Delongbacteria bacterium]
MNIRIEKTIDSRLLAKLNHDVQELHSRIEPDIYKPHDEEEIKKFFDSFLIKDNVFAYIAYFEDTPAGYIVLIKRDYPEGPFTKRHLSIHIDQICVENKFKGKGIGKSLIGFTTQFAKDNGINRIELDFWTKNKNAGEFFKSQGFETYDEKMRKTLK